LDVDRAIRARRTHKRYGPEPLDEAAVKELFDLARFAPNHQLTQPWRFRVLGEQTRARLNRLVEPTEALKLGRAPTLVLATALLSGDPVTDEEDLHAAACAVYAVLLGATARGLASYWRTPKALSEPPVRTLLQLADAERIVGLIHLGPAVGEPPAKERLPLDAVLRFLP
jgi:nitroreductase